MCVAGGADGIRIAKCENAEMVHQVEATVEAAEKEFGVEVGRTLLMAALESPMGIMNAYEIVTASDRMLGCAISGGDFRKSMHVQIEKGGVEMMVARGQMLLAARAAGVQCFDTMFPNIDDMEGFKAEVIQNHQMGFDGKSVVNPKQIAFVHETFAPTKRKSPMPRSWSAAVRPRRMPESACTRWMARWWTSPSLRTPSASSRWPKPAASITATCKERSE